MVGNFVVNKVEINLNMLRMSMKYRIGSKISGLNAVTQKDWSMSKHHTKVE